MIPADFIHSRLYLQPGEERGGNRERGGYIKRSLERRTNGNQQKWKKEKGIRVETKEGG